MSVVIQTPRHKLKKATKQAKNHDRWICVRWAHMFNNWWLKHNLSEDLRIQVDIFWKSITLCFGLFFPSLLPVSISSWSASEMGYREGCHSYRIPLSELHWKFVISKRLFLVFGDFMPSSSCKSWPIKDSRQSISKICIASRVSTPEISVCRITVKETGSRFGVWPGYWAEVEANKDRSSSVSLF